MVCEALGHHKTASQTAFRERKSADAPAVAGIWKRKLEVERKWAPKWCKQLEPFKSTWYLPLNHVIFEYS